MLTVHPQLEGTRIEHAWGGSVAVTIDRMPHVGHADGILYATGCNGSGVALNTWLGMRLGRMLAGDDPPPFAELPHRPIPARRLRSLYLPIVGMWFRWQDRGFGGR
jgi:glycine/D-amino acid oxidase-like deaminating enzyme